MTHGEVPRAEMAEWHDKKVVGSVLSDEIGSSIIQRKREREKKSAIEGKLS